MRVGDEIVDMVPTIVENYEKDGLESRVTVLGYVQRGGTPDAQDRLLGTLLGGAGADLIAEGTFGVTVAS